MYSVDAPDNIIERLNRFELVDPSDSNYIAPRLSGLEIALEALKKSAPNSPLIPHYEKLLKKSTAKAIDEGI